MRYVGKASMYVSRLAAYRNYDGGRPESSVEHRLYDRIAQKFGLLRRDAKRDKVEREPIRFAKEPCEYAAELMSDWRSLPCPAYLICCYASYPLTDKINAALHVHHSLGIAAARPLSFADAGSLSPVIALHWAECEQAETWMVCMEQVSAYRAEPPSADAFPDGDALAAVRWKTHSGDWQVLGYGLEQWGETADDIRLTAMTATLIDDTLREADVDPADVIVVPQSVCGRFRSALAALYPRVYSHRPALNLRTADVWYALEHLQAHEDRWTHAILAIADPKHGAGCVLLRRNRTG